MKITGRIAHAPRLRAPVTGKVCAAYSTRIDEWRYGLALRLVEQVSPEPLVVQDSSGLALVFPTRVRFGFARRDDRAFHGYMDQAPLAIARFLHGYGIDPRDEHGLYRPFGFHERLLFEGDLVTVFGMASWDAPRRGFSEESGYRSAPLQLVVAAPAGGPLLMSDDPRTFD